MRTSSVGRRYAKALLELAQESGQLAKVKSDLDALAVAWRGGADLRETFENPKVTVEMRKGIIEALAQRMDLSDVVRRTLRLLSDRRRMRELPQIADAFEVLAGEISGQVRAEVSTAVPMSDAYYEELSRALERVTGRRIALVKRTDPSLIGGVVARIGDKVFDGSVKNRLEELRDSLLLN